MSAFRKLRASPKTSKSTAMYQLKGVGDMNALEVAAPLPKIEL